MTSKLAEEVPWERGFYFVPGFRKYAIDREGVLKNLATNRTISWVKSKPGKESIKGGYAITNIHSDDGKRKGVSRHRLLALIFIPCPGDPKDYTVNHKDGVPGNDWIDNLEWTTYSENTKHAYDNDLYPNKTKPVILRYWETGEEKRFKTVVDCAKYLGASNSTVFSRVYNSPGIAYSDGLQLKFDDESPWIDPGEVLRNPRRVLDVAAKDISTGKIYVYSSMRQLAQALGLDYVTVQKRVRSVEEKPYRGYVIKEWSSDKNFWSETDAKSP